MTELTDDAVAQLTGIDQRTIDAVLHGRLADPFALFGPHRMEDNIVVRTFQPGALAVDVVERLPGNDTGSRLLESLYNVNQSGLFVSGAPLLAPGQDYLLRVTWPTAAGGEHMQYMEDPYRFGLLLGELDMHLLREGTHRELGNCLGANPMTIDGVAGTRFAVWAPNARRVSVVGDFNQWDGRRHPMRLRLEAGVWELFIPRLKSGARYQYEIVGVDGNVLPLKADPVARATEPPPSTVSVVASDLPFRWSDGDWMASRAARHHAAAPLSIYEVHAGSWLRILEEDSRSLNWHELGDRLIPYALGMGFTHIEFLPIMEHPFGGSWGYQPLGLFAPTARFGPPAGFASFVDRCHAAGLGVILDWVPAHFPTDAHGLVRFDGTALYEHQDPREGFHQDWNTLIYNLGRNEVCSFLIASALEWLERYHVDGLRVDAVASMLYRDYSRKHGEWVPNVYGGRENLEAVAFLRNLNQVIGERCPGAMMIAEESTAWPGVSSPVVEGGLGFTHKWNMGWMHDTLRYMAYDPLYRQYHHHDMTFGLIYAFSEKFVLPISHDEVVHGKGSLLNKMPGADNWQRLANLRSYLGFMWAHPGKKLLFMGCEIAQQTEWNHDASPDWSLLDNPAHRGVQRLVRDLNRIYAAEPALHRKDASPEGFAWVIGDDNHNSVFAFLRKGDAGDAPVVVVLNMTPVPREGYRIGVPTGGEWREVMNTDAAAYGGAGMGNGEAIRADAHPAHGMEQSLQLRLPPLAVLILKPAQYPAH
ncbi:1,4-alpha-glucan branching protein GlgB [Noviherbaspirillum autotrophicum]|uniref:1,4-alpha-glucan branching enzyme GlgB n=1 Tax=Noviherbaspirillum autotrophicum TaxID=709839 RepID=A0A0C2BLK6_9BURK|nr:1,4-alpha-glucan branching protein GlgB [Noviherbaspirillum autotrophicum]KIF80869.1 glycogen branching protein [Noviherbaspirillum autotrophicum]